MFSSFWPSRSEIRRPESTWLAILFGSLAGVLLPLAVLLIGWTIELAISGLSGTMPGELRVGPFALETSWLNAGESPLRGCLGLIVLLAITALLTSIAVLINERSAKQACIDFDTRVQNLLFTKSGALATQHGLSGQRSVLHEIQTTSIPRVREAILAWYIAMPRHWLQGILLLALAGWVHPWLTATAVLGLLALRSIYLTIESSRRKQRPVYLERWRAAREQLEYLCDTAPLLATIHDADDTAQNYRSYLQAYKQAGLPLLDMGGWRSPVLRWLTILFVAAFGALVAIRVLDRDAPIGVGGAAALCIAVSLAVMSFTKIGAAFAARRRADSSVQQVVTYLGQAEATSGDEGLRAPERIERELVLEHVTTRDNSGHKLLEDISLHFQPGQLTALVGTDPVQTKALAELILGFGKPQSGRLLIDGVDSIDVSREAIQKLSLWISPNGPLVSGSITDNLWIHGHPDATVDLMDVARRARVAEPILNLPEGLQTLVSPVEDRLQPDAKFRLGIARGFVKKPSIVVAEEPNPASRPGLDSDTTEALIEMKRDGMIVAVLPKRITTLRAADQVVVIHEHRIAMVGTHAELLEASELYRHWNYVRFSPGSV